MFDFDSAKDLTSGAVGGIGGGCQIMKTSQAGTSPAQLELLVTLVRALASWNTPPSW
jgi:hypothetical protein